MAAKSALISGMGVALGLVQGLVSAVRELGGTDEQIHELVTEQGKPKLVEMARVVIGAVKELLLRKVGIAAVSANKRFVADDEAAKRANVGYRSDQFKHLFGDKVEQDVPAATVAIQSLEKKSVDPPILTELGDKARLPLAYLFELMKKQSQGQPGKLLTNGYANIIYAVGNDSNTWAVNAYWSEFSRYWGVYAHSVAYPDPWRAGNQILSCDS